MPSIVLSELVYPKLVVLGQKPAVVVHAARGYKKAAVIEMIDKSNTEMIENYAGGNSESTDKI